MNKYQYFYSFLAGAIFTLAHAPFYFLPIILVSFTILFLAIENSSTAKKSLLCGWWFGFGHFLTGLYWISNSLFVDFRFVWLVPFAVSLIPAILAFFIAFPSLIIFYAKKLKLFFRVLIFVISLVLFELLRATLFTGFPWILTGYIWGILDETIQIASIIKIYGMSFLALIFGLSPVFLIKKKYGYFVTLFLTPAFLYGYGSFHLKDKIAAKFDYNLVLVQPNIPQSLKWDEAMEEANFKTLLQMSKLENDEKTLVIWPEAAFPYNLANEPTARMEIANLLNEKSFLITGSLRLEGDETHPKLYNSIEVVNSQGEIVAHYNKQKLVPFGEYIPLRKFLPFLNKITHGSIDFSNGEENQILKFADLNISPKICYEIIFPENISKKSKPDFILTVTNDGWFGNSIGPYQHFEMARFRAVEENIPAIRVANTGISGVIDEFGRVVRKTKLLEKIRMEHRPLPTGEVGK